MIIDGHGHYTTAPAALARWRADQLAGPDAPAEPVLSDDELTDSVRGAQLALQAERGTDLTIFSPRASAMGHHAGDDDQNLAWARLCNDTVHRVCALFPDSFAFACQLPQSRGGDPARWARELRRCVTELGAVGCNLNPDPSGGHWDSPPLTDRYWYPVYETMVELDVPAMIHVSTSDNPAFHTTGAHYLNADTTAFTQLLTGDLFRDFPTLRFVIPHGGGAVPYHWGRFRGLAQALGKPELEEHLLGNVYFDTCVYHQAGIDLLTAVVPADNLLFASELLGAVRGTDPRTGHAFDDTRRYVDAAPVPDEHRRRIFELTARTVYPRLAVEP